MSQFPTEILTLATKVIELNASRQTRVATAESCTGGLIAAALTEIAGSSAAVDRGFITYSNDAKMEMLGVTAGTLQQFGAVSRETALQMARGALIRSNAHLSVAVTGIAGPGGATPGKPVGLVHLCAAHSDGRLIHREMQYGDIGRTDVRLATVTTALQLLAELSA
ncbi:CinA family protein [Rhizobium sp. FKY42]|uniref:CinA family protein n=1 Tax=Rhizobium sp. FKY42 TaxID=2562310 RepID=UPI0010BF6E73|nr:CinA family protein [Rhizobium sp. FKY42]